jgi:hypothetical protein
MPAPTHKVTIPIAIERQFVMLVVLTMLTMPTSGRVLEPTPAWVGRTRKNNL